MEEIFTYLLNKIKKIKYILMHNYNKKYTNCATISSFIRQRSSIEQTDTKLSLNTKENLFFRQSKKNCAQFIKQRLEKKQSQIQQLFNTIDQQMKKKQHDQQKNNKIRKNMQVRQQQKRVDIIPDEQKSTYQQIYGLNRIQAISFHENDDHLYYKNKDNYINEKEFHIQIMSTGVFYPPSCSAYDITYCKGNDSVYAYGGISCTTELQEGLKQYFYKFDQGSWKQIKPVSLFTPMPRYGHTLTGTNDSLLLFGGVSQYKQKLKDRCFYPDVWSFNIRKNNWKVLQFSGPMIKNRKSHAACIYNKYYIVYGGIDDSQQVISDISWVNFQQKKSRWRNKKMQGRFNHQMAVHQTSQGRDYLFIFGGRNCQSEIIGQFLIYPIYTSQGQLHLKQAIRLSEQLIPCEFPIMKTIQSGVLIMGGINANNQAVNQCWFYNSEKQFLEQVSSIIDWKDLRGAKAVSLNNKHIYILSGTNSKKYKAIKISLINPDEQYKFKI